MRRSWVLALFLNLACNTRDQPPGTRDDAGTDAGTSDSGTRDGGTEQAGDPILERTPDLRYDCAAALPATRPENRSWAGDSWTYDLVTVGNDIMFGRIEREGDPIGIPAEVYPRLSTLSADGTFGATLALPIPSPVDVQSVALASVQSDLLFAYATNSGAQILHVAGSTIDAPQVLFAVTGTPQRIELATRDDGGVALYGSYGLDNRITYLLRPIDPTGAPTGPSFEVVRSTRAFLDPAANVIATASGYAVAWRDVVGESGEIYLRLFDTAGQPTGDTQTIYTPDPSHLAGYPTGFSGTAIPLLETDSGFLIGWVESVLGGETSGAFSMVALAKLDAGGHPLGAPVLLRSPELEIDYVEPELFHHGDAVGLAWSRGDHIYICAGCVPDHSIHMVLLDPALLIPISEVARIDPGQGGLLYRVTASNGTDIVTAFRRVFHVTSEGAIGSFRCTPR